MRSSHSRASDRTVTLARQLAVAVLGCTLAAVVLSIPSRVDGCGGVPAPQVCGKSTSLTKAPPAVFPVAFFGGVVGFPVTVNVAAWGGGCPAPTTTTISLSIACLPPTGAAGSITIPTPTPGIYPVIVPVFIPPGPPRICTVFGTATTTWADGTSTAGVGDTTFCVVEPSPLDLTLPRLEMERITDAVQRAHPGDQRVHLFRFTNNDPLESITFGVDADSEQTARLSTGSGFAPGSGQGVFSISDPGEGDNFPIAFLEDVGADGCIPLPIDPMGFSVPHISKTYTLAAGESRVIAIAQRSWPMCGCGSSCESRVKVGGVWSDGTEALACAGAGLIVDCTVPPDFSCPDGGAAWNLTEAPPWQLSGAIHNPAIADGMGSVRILSSEVIANGMFDGMQSPSLNFDGVRGRMEATHFAPDVIAQENQFILVNAVLEAGAAGPGYQSQLTQLTPMDPPENLMPEWIWIDARHTLVGPGIPPALDSFFDVFYSVQLDGVSGGLHRRARILPNSFSVTPISGTQYGITFTAQFLPVPGLPPFIERIDLHVDASGTLIGSLDGVVPPVNDECSDALEINAGETAFTTIGATTSDAPLPDSCDDGFGTSFVDDIWFYYQSGGDGVATVSTCGAADFDTRIAVYSGCPADGGELLACNDDARGCADLTSQLSFPAVCGGVYVVRLGGFGGAGSGTVSVTNDGVCEALCAADLNGDGVVNAADLAILLGAWATTGPGDLNGDGVVDAADLAVLLGAFGECPVAATADYQLFFDPEDTKVKYGVANANGSRAFIVTAVQLGSVALKDGTPDLETNLAGDDSGESRVKCVKAGPGSIRIKILKGANEVFNDVICFECEAAEATPVEVVCP
ncbi:MAG: GC-type dockerin domain-anchored protein [Phycisphaerae bacterium]|nr:GC-type dockerin domain-anchored protein [Phycisphaerae bacterium]